MAKKERSLRFVAIRVGVMTLLIAGIEQVRRCSLPKPWTPLTVMMM
jgi:hypothetical protein